jgi:TPR repeat protein
LSDPQGDPALAAQWLSVACGKQDAVACTSLAKLELTSAQADQVIRARMHLRSACDGKDGEGCWLLAQMLRDGRGGPVDERQANGLGPQACDLGVAAACRDTAERWLKLQDIQGGLGWLRKACHAKDEGACSRLAALHEGADGGPVDVAAATEALLHACHLGHAAACGRAADRYASGKEVAAAPELARQLLEQGCRLGNPLGCTRLAVLLADGKGGAADPSRAQDLWRSACDQGLGEACRHLAGHAAPAAASALWRRGCEAGDADGCAGWSVALRQTLGADAATGARAATLERQACAMGSAWGCLLQARSVRGSADPAAALQQALPLLQQACAGGSAQGCVEWAQALQGDPQRAAAAWAAACAAGWRQGPCAKPPAPVRPGTSQP